MLFRGFWENLKKPIIGLAPMDGATDAAFRYMVAKCHKPDVMMTEFTNVEGMARGASKMLVSFLYEEIERPIVGQLFGVEVESYYKCSVMLCALGFDGVDINMGCPVNKVARKGSGAALIKTPGLAREIIRACKRGVKDWADGISLEGAGVHENIIIEIKKMVEGREGGKVPACAGMTEGDARMTGGAGMTEGLGKVSPGTTFPKMPRKIIPVSVKTRIGYDEIMADEWVKHLLEEQPANITMHGRTLKQMYMGKANWEVLAKAAKVVHESGLGISFLGNGDVESMEDAYRKVKEYGVDGVLVGRAVLGNPWFFGGKDASLKDRLEILVEHARYFQELGHLSFFNIRKHLGWYCKGFDGAKDCLMKLIQVENAEEVVEVVKFIVGKSLV